LTADLVDQAIGFLAGHIAEPRHTLAHGFCLTLCWRELDSNFRFRARFG